MTLHWWMHWFWVTVQFLAILGNPLPTTTTDSLDEAQDRQSAGAEISLVDMEEPHNIAKPARQSFRIAKAIGLYPQTNTAVMLERQATPSSQTPLERSTAEATSASVDVVDIGYHGNSSIDDIDAIRNNGAATMPQRTELERLRSPTKKDSKITWIEATSKVNRSKYDQDDRRKDPSSSRNVSVPEVEDLTVLPLQEEGPKFRLIVNRTRPSSSLLSSSPAGGNVGIRTFNRSDDDVEVDEELVEPQPFATAASILEVGVSRTRSTFPKDFQRDQVQEGNPPDYNGGNSGAGEEQDNSTRSAVDIAAITGSCLATVVLLSAMGSLGFIMYRRRYLNPPQTLNSDKCSNPDSSGYIDDSTIRDNSEEMYSLDNDSFLNSLEAMTIQNYWTDSVKHTKL